MYIFVKGGFVRDCPLCFYVKAVGFDVKQREMYAILPSNLVIFLNVC